MTLVGLCEEHCPTVVSCSDGDGPETVEECVAECPDALEECTDTELLELDACFDSANGVCENTEDFLACTEPIACVSFDGDGDGRCGDLCDPLESAGCIGSCYSDCEGSWQLAQDTDCRDEYWDVHDCIRGAADVCDPDCSLAEDAFDSCTQMSMSGG